MKSSQTYNDPKNLLESLRKSKQSKKVVEKDSYSYKFGNLFNWIFHVGIIVNFFLISWLYLLFFEVI